MTRAKIIALHAFTDDEALMWLTDRLDGRVEIAPGELARQFGWPLARLRQRLAAWSEDGRIVKRAGARGKLILEPAVMPREAAQQLVGHAFRIGGTPAPPPTRSAPVAIAAALLFATAIGLTAVGLIMNARFAASFGQTAEAAALLAAIGLAVDLLAVMLPGVAIELFHRRARLAAGAAWTLWLAVLAMTWLAATGFASTEIGDAVAGRARIAGESALIAERIERLRQERSGIAETRPVASIAVELQRAQPQAQSVWRITDGCRDVTRPASARACAEVLDLRQAQAAAERRDAIDTELHALQARRAALPAVATADPQAATAADLVTWLSVGTIAPSAADIARLRALGLALTPSLAGVILMLALILARRPNRGL
ncbi:MAG: hypothetical protein IT536_20655 [Hyphomicrobiales bacterium]|nr:hypothetical protein [Hyphomicrobiales bacterium]